MNSSTFWFRSLPAVLALLSAVAQAADPAPAKPTQAPESALASAPTTAAAGAADARVSVAVIEDDSTRIEETRVRGQTQKVTVQPKNSNLPGYEILMVDGGRDLSAGPGSTRGGGGKRVWNLFNF